MTLSELVKSRESHSQAGTHLAQLELRIRKHFPSTSAVTGFDLDVILECGPGVTVLFGASGSGKTLTLECVAGLLRPDEGRILLENEILYDARSGVFLPPQKRGVGYVFQNYALFPHMTIEQNLSFGIARMPGLERHRRVREMLDLFGLSALAGRHPHELSGGEKQRASIARALIAQPRLLLLDEPARGLDYPLRQDFYAVVRNVRENYRIPTLLVTHDATEGFLLGDQMAIFRAGRIVQTGKPEDIFFHPRNTAVARLLGIPNIFSGIIESLDPMAGSCSIRTDDFRLEVPYLPGHFRGDSVWFCIPREHVTLSPVSPSTVRAAENQIPVRIVAEVSMPDAVRLTLRVNRRTTKSESEQTTLETDLSRAAYKKMGISSQKDWMAALPKGSIHIFPEQLE